jgi:hypothetical protein
MKYVGWPKTESSARTNFSHTPAGGPAASLGDSQSLLPLPAIAMTEACDFIASLAKAAKCQQELNWDKTL